MKVIRPLKVTDAMLVSSSVPELWDNAAWSNATTYGLGQRVNRLHRIYESAIAGNLNIDPAVAGSAWIEVGPATRWAMFDPAAGPRTTWATTLTVVLAPGTPVRSLGMLDVSGASVRVQVSAGGPDLYDQTRANPSPTLTFLDLPAVASPTITVTIAPTAGAASIGKLILGTAVDLGATETGPTISLTDFSRRETDEFGVTTVVERAWAKRVALRSRIASSQADAVHRLITALRATPALWIGEEGFEALTLYGFYKDFAIDLQLGDTTYCSLTIEGLPEAAATIAIVDPAPNGSSDFRVVRPAPIAGTVFQSSTVPEVDHPEWSAITNYGLGSRVIKAATHRIYESVTAGNVGNDPASAAQWTDVGATNRWAMFDEALGSATTATTQIVVTLKPDAAMTALAILDTNAASVRVQAPGYDRTQNTTAGGVTVTALTFLDIAVAAGATITVTITATGAGLPVSVGTLLLGTIEPLGITETSPTVTIADFSRKDADDFGNTTLIERAWAKRMAVRSLVSTSAVDGLMRRVASLRAKPALWIGQEGFDTLAVFGFFRDFSVEVAERLSTCSVTIEGLSKATPLIPAEPPIRFLGDWEAGESYPKNAVLRFGGRSFASLVDNNIGHQPPATATDDQYWYAVSDRGDDGTNGVPGAPGANGQTTYVHFAWANSADGASGFSTSVSAGKLYIGAYTDFLEPDSTNPALYSWTKIKGEDGLQGTQGIPGAPGANGQTTYFHLAYADNATGTLNFTTGDAGARTYIGVYTDFSPADSSNPAAYTWSKYVGADGSNGTPGAPGANGQTSYVHFAWANSADGSLGFSTTVSAGKLYIGAYSDFTLADSSNPAAYRWSKIKGEDGLAGTQGIPGAPGANGQTSYVHFAYANSADGSVAFTTGSADGRFYVGVYVDFTPADSGNPAAYTWSLQRGADGTQGTPGAPGSNGQPSYVHTAYANNASGTQDFHLSDPTGRTFLGVYTDFTAADSSNPAVYSWSLIKGADGAPGAPGVSPIQLTLSTYSIDVAADYNNVTKAGSLPRGSVISLKQGTTALTPSSIYFGYADGGAGAFSASYDALTTSPTVSLNVASSAGWIDVYVVYAGVTYNQRISVTRTKDNPPAPSQTSVGALLQTPSTASTTYDGSGISYEELLLKANASGVLYVDVACEYSTDQGQLVRSLIVAGRTEIAPQSTGVFSAPVAEHIGSQASWNKVDAYPGTLTFTDSLTGLTPGAFYRVRINTRKHSGSNPYAWVTGDFTVRQS